MSHHIEDALEVAMAAHMKTHAIIIALRELMALEGQLNTETLDAKVAIVKDGLTNDVPEDTTTLVADFVPTRRPAPVEEEFVPAPEVFEVKV